MFRMNLGRSWKLFRMNLNPYPEGEKGLKVRDHRSMVGGRWDEIGKLQFEYLVKEGMAPTNVLLDIGCGSFRAGHRFITYLEPGNYLGIDKQHELIREGRAQEVGEVVWQEKEPEIVISDAFEFGRLSKKPDFALAQSLFTHLSRKDIRKCLKHLGDFAPRHCRLYATFFEAPTKVINIFSSHSSRRFEYTANEMKRMGAEFGWEMTYIGDWNHPRNQKLVLFKRAQCI